MVGAEFGRDVLGRSERIDKTFSEMGVEIIKAVVSVLSQVEVLLNLVDCLGKIDLITGGVGAGKNGGKSLADVDGLGVFDGSNFIRVGRKIVLVFGVQRMGEIGLVDDNRQPRCRRRNCGKKYEV